MVAINVIRSVPTNIITGFLGAGKTTAINHLLTRKPAQERWAVLVNEFGQIGVDQSLISQDDSIQIQEIPGGCLCCARGPQLRVALTRLLRSARPDRLIIEPTGLGHPLGIVDLLLGPDFASVIDLRSMICLIDPRVLEQPEILANPVFGDQIDLADILVLNKADLCSAEQLGEAQALSNNMFPPKQQVLTTRMGELDPTLLDRVRSGSTTAARPSLRPRTVAPNLEQSTPEQAAEPGQPLRFKGEMEGFHSQSWLFHADDCFDSTRILEFLDQQRDSLRIKAAIRIGHGWIGYNRMLQERSVTQLAWRRDSRIELLSTQSLDMDELGLKLQGCLKN
ncbi:cobalamin biosynthesis protein CobW [Marinobacterium zhoushanense]|uniref:Cobalamin biosynthesis protein CobW n=1 Tax=Marinobacterium zhoushanense TaxID=1679163 RepID=A0ABQ1JZT5_9GAMM|nr:CobW family GTP-binding protein [Marinobacterium zhoushanense]GGB83201.1 cobalamin biosynthesis protein CobW [Marinobacterium zhoushanense]